MIRREKYIKPVRPFYESDLIKIFTGIRRCGKSVILNEIMAEIKEKSDNVILIDFEDLSNLSKIPDTLSLIKSIEEKRKGGLCYVFLDEVQRRADAKRISE